METRHHSDIDKRNLSALEFKSCIELKDVNFRYKSKIVFNRINLKIYKGDRVGFVGITGSGKSTLLDIIMGLMQPNSGFVCVDDVVIDSYKIELWQKHIAHVPQNIFLSDSSIYENIAFGVSKEDIDYDFAQDCAKKAKIHDEIMNLDMEYLTTIGERGIRLSGGQRQRIGIARALYCKPDLLVLDEATSALDTQTEELIMREIETLDDKITILIVAYRLSTIESCNKIVKVSKGDITLDKKI